MYVNYVERNRHKYIALKILFLSLLLFSAFSLTVNLLVSGGLIVFLALAHEMMSKERIILSHSQ